MLWLAMLGLAVVAGAAVVWPLLRWSPATAARRPDLAVYRDQLREIDREQARGLLDAKEAAAVRLEIERRILSAAAQPSGGGARMPRSTGLAIALALALPVGGFLLYLTVGQPWLPIETPAQSAAPDPRQQDRIATLTRMAEALSARLAAAPDNATEWQLLGDLYGALGRYPESAAAYAQALAKSGAQDGDVATLHSAQGEALTLASGGQVTGPARAAFEAALARDPKQPKARYFLALARAQAGQVEQALSAWVALEAETPADTLWRPLLAAEIERAARQLGRDPATLPGRTPKREP